MSYRIRYAICLGHDCWLAAVGETNSLDFARFFDSKTRANQVLREVQSQQLRFGAFVEAIRVQTI